MLSVDRAQRTNIGLGPQHCIVRARARRTCSFAILVSIIPADRGKKAGWGGCEARDRGTNPSIVPSSHPRCVIRPSARRSSDYVWQIGEGSGYATHPLLALNGALAGISLSPNHESRTHTNCNTTKHTIEKYEKQKYGTQKEGKMMRQKVK